MLTSREIYSPEARLQDTVETKEEGNNNLDSEFLAAFRDTEDTLILALQGALKTRDVRAIDNRILAPLFSTGLVSQGTLDAFNRLSYHASVVKQDRKTLPKASPIISRYRRPTEADDRMPGSCLPLSKKQMKILIKEAGSLNSRFDKLATRIKRPQTQGVLSKAMKAR